MRRHRPTALRRTQPVDPVPGAITDPVQDYWGASSNSASANRNKDHGKEPLKTAAAYLVASDVPQDASITEAELRAIDADVGA